VCVVDGVWLCSTGGGLEALVRLAVTNIVYNIQPEEHAPNKAAVIGRAS